MSKSLPLCIILFCAATFLIAGQNISPHTTIPKGSVQKTDINAFGGSVVIEGKLDASLFMIGGNLRILGEVSGDVICIGSEVTIADTASIDRDLWVISNRFERSERSRVAGRIVHVKNLEDLRKTASIFLPFVPEGGDLSIFKIIKITFWFIFSLIILALFTDRIINTSEKIGKSFFKLGFRGFYLFLLFIFLLVLFAFLSLFLIGIPLLLVLLIFYFIADAFGRTVIFYSIGHAISRGLRTRRPNPTYCILLGILPYAACKFIPVAGALLILVMDFVALGISTAAVTKKRAAA